MTLMCSGGTLKPHVFLLESTEPQRRERANESKLRRAPEPARQAGGRELRAAAALRRK